VRRISAIHVLRRKGFCDDDHRLFIYRCDFCSGSDPVIRGYRLNVRFARKRTRLGASCVHAIGMSPASAAEAAPRHAVVATWNDDDFNVLADGVVLGRIMRAAAVPVGVSWMWTLALRLRGDRARLRWHRSPRAGGGSSFIKMQPVQQTPSYLSSQDFPRVSAGGD
jgi:hypothetical protein